MWLTGLTKEMVNIIHTCMMKEIPVDLKTAEVVGISMPGHHFV